MINKEFYFTNSRFKFIVLILILMWVIFITILFIKLEEITKDPCSICAKRLGNDISCHAFNSFYIIEKVYYFNGTTKLTKPGLLLR